MRFAWLLAGHLALSLGVIGIFLPLLPTTPFLLLASFCYARGSERFELWLLNHRHLGPPVKAWKQSGAIGIKTKIVAILAIAVSGISVGLMDHIPLYGRAAMAVMLVSAATFIATRPNA